MPIFNKTKKDNSPIFFAVKLNRIAAIELFCDRLDKNMFNRMVDSHG